MPVKAGYLLLAGGGAVVIWSGMKGKSVTGVVRSLVGGQNPAKLPDVNNVAGVIPVAGNTNTGTSNGSPTVGAGQLPAGGFQNAQAIWVALRAMGLTKAAAAGVAGNIYQESKGNPHAYNPAGGGLFGLTDANGGNPNGGSLGQQITALLAYINANGSVYDINTNSPNPSAAATYFCNAYERPGAPALSIRIAAAQWVYKQKWAV